VAIGHRLEYITPHSLDRLDTPSKPCIVAVTGEAPNVADPHVDLSVLLIVRFTIRTGQFSGSFEFEQMFGRLPFSGLKLGESPKNNFAEKIIEEEMENT